MNKYIIYVLATPLILLSIKASNGGVNVNINIENQGPPGYYSSLANYYRVKDEDVYFIKKRGIPDDQLPVIFQIASHANVSPALVAKRYGPGVSLLELTRIFGLTPEIYYVPVKVKVDGPPYGKAYGYYRNRARKEWKNIYLNDDDIINFSNLRFMSGYYEIDPDVIIKKRSGGKDFILINDDFYKGKKSKSDGQKKYYESGKKHDSNNHNVNEKNINKDFDKEKNSKGKNSGKKNKN
jgi:hypothetical protein